MNLEFALYVCLIWLSALGAGLMVYLIYLLVWVWPGKLIQGLKNRISLTVPSPIGIFNLVASNGDRSSSPAAIHLTPGKSHERTRARIHRLQ